MVYAFTFPGQGSQAVAMGKELAAALPAARQVYEQVDDALGQNLSRLMWEGPIEKLTLTENTQPALMAVSLAVVRALESELDLDMATSAQFVAGHSLGEYSALTAAGSLSINDAARLLKKRGLAMQDAVPVGEGAMAAVLGLDFDAVSAIAKVASSAGVCAAANDNAPGQVVISGSKRAVDAAIEIAKDKGAKRALELPVSAPFHCSLMAPAAEVMREALADVTIAPPKVHLVANVTASMTDDPESIRQLLVEQVTGMVRWRETITYMVDHRVDTVLELGPGKVLSGLAKRINRKLTAIPVETLTDVKQLAGVL